MAAVSTNEAPGTRAVLRHSRTSAFKVRPVLDLIRGQDVQRARAILQLSERDAARLVNKVLASAIANAENNDGLDPDELYVSACYADEGTTMKRWRPRARGRATRIRKRTCHITVIVSRLPEEKLARIRARQAGEASRRARRVAGGRHGRRGRRQDRQNRQDRQDQPEPSPVIAEVVQERGESGPSTAPTQEGGDSATADEGSESGGAETV